MTPVRSYRGAETGMLVPLLLYLLLTCQTEASCRGSCGACARRYGCMTPAWGKCCTQFFMHNGRKRSMMAKPNQGVMETFIQYVQLKSKMINRPSMDDTATSSLRSGNFPHTGTSTDADTGFPSRGDSGWPFTLGGSTHTASLDPVAPYAEYQERTLRG